jgi:hypothetical protein
VVRINYAVLKKDPLSILERELADLGAEANTCMKLLQSNLIVEGSKELPRGVRYSEQ